MPSDASSRDLSSSRLTTLAAVACVLFGLLLILSTHPIGDGLWFWYAVAWRQGQRLYADLHLNLQPLFVLLTAAFQAMLGPGWLASKVLPALQLMAYCTGLLLVTRHIPWRDWQRALLLLAVFGLTITSTLSRFDDYHITTQCLQLFSLVLLLRLTPSPANSPAPSPASRLASSCLVAALLGTLSGLCLATRINDGAGLAIAVFLALLVLLPKPRTVPLIVFCLATPATLLAVVLLTGDSPGAWWSESIAHAARMKGGGGSVVLAPLKLPWRLGISALQPKGFALLLAVLFPFLLFRRLPGALPRGHRLSTSRDLLLTLYLLLLAALFAWQAWKGLANPKLSQLLVLVLLVLGVWVHGLLARALLRPALPWNRLSVLLLVPFWAAVATAMSSGRYPTGFEPEAALLLLLTPLALPWSDGWRSPAGAPFLRRGLLVIAALAVLAALPEKTRTPYEWQHYHDAPLFVGRTWYRHPLYGPMLIDRDQLAFMLPLCRAVRQQSAGQPTSLLSLPYPYANYFCGIPPWHGYVQTWYDTSSPDRIGKLRVELSQAPPEWIVYQRALDTIALHELVFSGGALPHRALDQEIMDHLVAGQWTLVSRRCFSASDWLLIHTTPGPARLSPSVAADRSAQCIREDREARPWAIVRP